MIRYSVSLLISQETSLVTMKTVCIAHPLTVKQLFTQIEDIVNEEEHRKGNGVDVSMRFERFWNNYDVIIMYLIYYLKMNYCYSVD